MCGICGFTGATETDAPTLKAMCDIMAHRGPDGEGQYLADGVALGHRRLSLIDLENGSQPMVRATGAHDSIVTSPATEGSAPGSFTIGDYAIVFNGEIYNYRDLRDELAADGWTFKTESDTETLLVSYLAWGKLLLDKVRGMFAFAIWDKQRGELFCARDFFGIKPFYYTVQNGEAGPQFIFASEIKCILEHPAYERELNEEALEQYLCFQFSALPETFFKGIYKLEPAHCMTVRADGTTETERYWRPTYDFDQNRSREDTVKAIDAAMADGAQGGYDVPAHLKDAHYQGAQQLGRGLTYRYPHDYPGHWVPQQYLPDELKGRVYYQPGDNKLEQQAQAYWQKVKGSRQN